VGEYKRFVRKINDELNINLNLYKEAQMKRRLTSLRNKRGFRNFDSYFDALSCDEALLDEFLDRMTINVSEFYRNPRRWDVLREKVLPKLAEKKAGIKIWSAACSTGEEPYSLAIMLNEHFKEIDVSIIATDIDEKALEKAKLGTYDAHSLKELSSKKKSKYFLFNNNKYCIDERLKSNISFKKHDLLKDPYPGNVDLIVCRNVLIYFTDPAKKMIYKRFGEALSQNGFLFVGSTEQIFNPQEFHLTLYDTFFYRKK